MLFRVLLLNGVHQNSTTRRSSKAERYLYATKLHARILAFAIVYICAAVFVAITIPFVLDTYKSYA
jgi:hypothetical protein